MTTTDTPSPVTIDWPTLTDEELVNAYMICRERKEKAAAAEERAEGIMKQIKAAMLAKMNAAGTTGFKVAGVATVSRTLRSFYKSEDRPQFLSWILAHAAGLKALGKDPLDAFAFMHAGITGSAVKDWMDANNGLPPPSIKVTQEYDIRVTPTN